MEKYPKPILCLRAKGPATEGNRLPLADLLLLGKCFQTAVDRVARVLSGEADSRRRGRKPPEIGELCRLEVVALQRGSFEIALDFAGNRLDGLHLGRDAVQQLLVGWGQIGSDGGALPAGYDMGVLHSLRDLGRLLERGISEVEVESRITAIPESFRYDQGTREQVLRRIRKPVSNTRTLEGRLLMADFRVEGERCRLHPPIGDPIVCTFDESLSEKVLGSLRGYVRVRGETREDAETGRIASIAITAIEPVSMGEDTFEKITAEDFWQEKTVEELAAEQGLQSPQDFDAVFGKAAALWESDEDFETFLAVAEGIAK